MPYSYVLSDSHKLVCNAFTFLLYAYNTVIIYAGALPPTNVRATLVMSRSMQITWEPSSSSNVNGYHISYTTIVSYASSGIVTVGGSATSTILTNLEEDTLYTINVQATASDNGVSLNSTVVSVRTYTDGK